MSTSADARPVDVPLVGTVKDTVEALLAQIRGQDRRQPPDRACASTTSRPAAARRVARQRPQPRRRCTRSSSRRRSTSSPTADAVFIPDVGTPVIWAARYLTMNGRRRLIGSFSHGSMANAVPQAIGVQASQPGRQVVTLSGDGGLAMMLGDLITLQQLDLPVKIVVFNNGALSFVELEMKADGFVNFGTDLTDPNFAAVAPALGMHGERVDHPDDLADALRAAFDHDGSALVEVMTAVRSCRFHPRSPLDEVKGFYALRHEERVVWAGRRAHRPRPAPTSRGGCGHELPPTRRGRCSSPELWAPPRWTSCCTAVTRHDGTTTSFPRWEFAEGVTGWDEASAPGQVGQKLEELVITEPAPDGWARTTTNLVHWATGVGWGLQYGLLARARPGTGGARS